VFENDCGGEIDRPAGLNKLREKVLLVAKSIPQGLKPGLCFCGLRHD
jgi:hypothetical protein